MKQMIKLLSVLLLIAAVMIGCSQKDSEETADPSASASLEATEEVFINEEFTHESVEAKLENFLIPEEEGDGVIKNAIRKDGELVSSTDRLLVFRQADVDTMAVVTETFTVYNAASKTTVLTTTNSYIDGDYAKIDWSNSEYRDVTLPESVMEVSVETLSSDVEVIKVSTAKITKIDEETIEENDNACHYAVAFSFEYYDITGKFLAKTISDQTPSQDDKSEAYTFGTTYVTFDSESGKAVRILNGETETLIKTYDEETERYGYFFYDVESACGSASDCQFVEVYNKKTDECILRYYIDAAIKFDSTNQVFVLDDGDLLIQSKIYLPEHTNIEPDYYENDMTKVKVEHFHLDVETGLAKALDLDYLIQKNYPHEKLNDNRAFVGFTFSEHVVNLALIDKIEGNRIVKSAIAVLDNDLSLMYEMPMLVPEHDLSSTEPKELGLELLSNGNYLVTLDSGVSENRAISTKSGTLLSYLPKDKDARTVGNYVVTKDAIFDHSMNTLYIFDEENCELSFTFGDKIVIKTEEIDEYDEPITVYYELTGNGSSFTRNEIFTDISSVVDYDSSDDYVIVMENGLYVLYNANFEHVLSTESTMNVKEADGNLYVLTEHQAKCITGQEGTTLVYIID